MSDFTLNSVIIVSIWLLVIVKVTYDQLNLFRLYKEKIDSSFPVSQVGVTLQNLVPTTKRRLRVIFKKYPSQPEVDKLARKIRYELAIVAFIFVLLFVLSLFTKMGTQ